MRALLLGLMLTGLQQQPSSAVANAPGGSAATEQDPAFLKLGLAPRFIRLAAAGYMLDFRYQVLNPERAAKLINKTTHPYLIDEADGAKLMVPAPPKVGPLRNTGSHLVEGKTYFIIFANPGRRIERGDRVTVVLGEQRIEHLVVQ